MSNAIAAERLERALALAAYLVVRDGAVALPPAEASDQNAACCASA